MRAYHRVDPLADERKGHYSPAQFGAFMKVQLVAGRQTRRGRFRSLDALRRTLPAAYAKHVDFLVSEGDVDVLTDGSVYFDGWDEWQEGDLTVQDRMARLRNRRRNASVTDTVTSTVTQPSPTATRYSVGISVSGSPNGEPRATDGLPNLDETTIEFLEASTGRSASTAGPKTLTEYDRQIADHGFGAIVKAYDTVVRSLPASPKPTARQLVWSAMKILEPFASPKEAERQERETEQGDDWRRRLERTKVNAHESGAHVASDPACPRCRAAA